MKTLRCCYLSPYAPKAVHFWPQTQLSSWSNCSTLHIKHNQISQQASYGRRFNTQVTVTHLNIQTQRRPKLPTGDERLQQALSFNLASCKLYSVYLVPYNRTTNSETHKMLYRLWYQTELPRNGSLGTHPAVFSSPHVGEIWMGLQTRFSRTWMDYVTVQIWAHKQADFSIKYNLSSKNALLSFFI